MAENVGTKLDEETRKRLSEMDVDIKTAKREIQVMENLGMNVDAIKEKIDWAEQTRKTLLEEFG